MERQGIITSIRVRKLSEKEDSDGNVAIVSSSDVKGIINILDPIYFKTKNRENVDIKQYQRSFSFDHSFVDNNSQDEVYEECGKPLVQHCLNGYNCSIIAFGQTVSNLEVSIVMSDVFLLIGEWKNFYDDW